MSPTEINQRIAEIDQEIAALQSSREKGGMYWCNSNAIIQSYNTARSRVLKTGGALHFRKYEGTGRFVNQIQGGMTVSDLFAGRSGQVSVIPLPENAFTAQHRGERRRLCRTFLTVTAFTGRDDEGKHFRRTLRFPMILHRPLPPQARIKEVHVNAKLEGDTRVWSVTFTLTDELQPPTLADHPSLAACGINYGWRQTTGGIRIATLVSSGGPERAIHHYLPQKLIDRAAYCEQLQGELDESANEMRALLAQWDDELPGDSLADSAQPPPEEWSSLVTKALRSRSVAPLYALAVAWRAWTDWHPDKLDTIEEWRRADKRKRLEMEGLRRKAIGHRNDHYRNLAKQIADTFAIIGIGQLDLKKAAKKKTAPDDADVLPPSARRIRQLASLSTLIEWVEKQALKTGALVVEAERPVTSTCGTCGGKEKIKPDAISHLCSKCGAVYDRDVNAALIAMQDAVMAAMNEASEPKPDAA